MIHSLRKRHYLIWQIWAVLLPLFFTVAYFTRPNFSSQKLTLDNLPQALPIIVQELDNQDFKINLRTDEQKNYQLEIYIKNSFKSVAPMVYLKKNNQAQISTANQVGGINGRGLYRFPLAHKPQGIFFYALVHDKVLAEVDFK
jgi:hypothetical protein